MSDAVRLTGGCQCGAIRYALHEEPRDPHICHCRMCQKAFGSYFAPLAGVARENFELTRGTLATFMSSDKTARGFCRECGTPLTFDPIGYGSIAFSIGSLDDPARVVPTTQSGIEGRVGYFAALPGLPGVTIEAAEGEAHVMAIRATNHQHPDHDTSAWPPAGEERT